MASSQLREHLPPLGSGTRHLALVFGIRPRPLDIHTSPSSTSSRVRWAITFIRSSISRKLFLLANAAYLFLRFAASSGSVRLLGYGPRYARINAASGSRVRVPLRHPGAY
ncbi:hypothetical protein TSAR_009561 [Trichomalopsis sarcophagae]|uniref:Uncharacterized protein n=1 Tax=Trichomalopsis sarcophagae TaxID=543379 RepID=A0A232ESV7_9HYME|nr:hypothetical protein TSAR_009561 [Trichomalopsis sarcophagae]